MIENDVIAYLKSDTTLDGYLNSTATDSKIYPDEIPQDSTEPYICYHWSVGLLDENLNEDRIQLNIYGSDKAVVDNIRDRIITLLDLQDSIQGTTLTSSTYWIFYSKLTAGSSVISTATQESYYLVTLFFNIKFCKKS